MDNSKHRWTFDEDLYCCKICIETYVINKSNMSISDFVRKLSHNLPGIPENSLRMKIQNIKQIFEETGLENTLSTKPLANYSKQNEKAMSAALKESF